MAKAKRDLYQEVTDIVIKALEEGTQPWSRPWATGKGMSEALRVCGTPYRGINAFLLGMTMNAHGYNSPHFMTYNAAKKLGGQVRKGEKGHLSVFFRMLEIDSKTNPGTKENIPLLRHSIVFNAAQIDGLPDRFYVEPAEINQEDRSAEVDEWLAKTGCTIKIGGDSAHLNLLTGLVHMPAFESFKDARSFYSTACHELTHWQGMQDGDIENDKFGSANYAREELIAELGAAFLMGHLGLGSEPRADHAPYIASWLKVLKEDKRAIFRASSAAQKRVDALIARVEPKQESEAA